MKGVARGGAVVGYGICAACARRIAVRKNGTVRKHKTKRGPCGGAGKPAVRGVA